MTLLDFMMTAILIALFIGMLFIVTFIYKLLHRVEVKDNSKEHKAVPISKASLHDAVIMQVLCRIKLDLFASKIILARFHNGGSFMNGYEMKRFTITHETPDGSHEPLMDKCVSVLNSKYASSMLQLVTCEYICYSDIKDCHDKAFQNDMKYYGFQSTNLFLIRQLGDNTVEGFIGVNFRDTHVMDSEERQKVMEHIPRILNLVNMKESSLKD